MVTELGAEVKQKPLILIVDKDTTHTEQLREGLEPQGFRVLGSFLKKDAEELVISARPNIVCVDPVDLGFGVKKLKEITSVPIIVLSRLILPSHRLRAYRQGADLYLVKSTDKGYEDGSNPDVLASYVRAILSKLESTDKKSVLPPFTLQYERGLSIDVLDAENCAVFRYGAPVYIQPQQTRLLALLATEPGKMFTHQEILAKNKGAAHVIDSNTISLLRMDISRLRNRLKPDDGFIQTARCFGYYLLPPSEEFTLKESVLFNQENLVITESGRVKLEGEYIPLSSSQRRILMILALNPGFTISADTFLGNDISSVNTVKNQVAILRKKLGRGSRFIKNIDGGYQFN